MQSFCFCDRVPFTFRAPSVRPVIFARSAARFVMLGCLAFSGARKLTCGGSPDNKGGELCVADYRKIFPCESARKAERVQCFVERSTIIFYSAERLHLKIDSQVEKFVAGASL
jgi:hypothetical protein